MTPYRADICRPGHTHNGHVQLGGWLRPRHDDRQGVLRDAVPDRLSKGPQDLPPSGSMFRAVRGIL